MSDLLLAGLLVLAILAGILLAVWIIISEQVRP